MTQMVTKYAAKKMLSKSMNQNKDKEVSGKYDPYYCMIPDKKRPGKMKKVKRQIPDYIPEEDAVILAKMRQRAYWLDMSLFNFCGVRFGWSSLIGIIPAFGDAVDGLLALLLFQRCCKISCGLGMSIQIRMLINIVFDFVIGLVPFVGDIIDAGVKVNSKNVRLLEERLDEVYKPKRSKSTSKKEPKRDHHGSRHNRRDDYDEDDFPTPPATEYEYFSDDEGALPKHRQDITSPTSSRRDNGLEQGVIQSPQSARTRNDPRDVIDSRPDRQGSRHSRGNGSNGSNNSGRSSRRPSTRDNQRRRRDDTEAAR